MGKNWLGWKGSFICLVLSTVLLLSIIEVASANPGIDISIELVGSPQTSYKRGDTVTLWARIKNTGDITIYNGKTTAIFWVVTPSGSSLIDGYDKNTHGIDPDIDPGQVYVFESTWTIPSNAELGWYGIKVSVSACPAESQSGYCVTDRTFTGSNNFQVTEATTPPPSTGKIQISLQNNDDDQQDVKIYVDGEHKGTQGMPSGYSTTFPDISVSGSANHEVKITWHDDDTGQDYQKSNTVYVGGGETKSLSFTIDQNLPAPQKLPDLWVTDLEIQPYNSDKKYTIGQQITIYPHIKNEGQADAGSFKINFYVDGSVIYTWPVSSLAVGGTVTSLGATWTMSEGTHTIKVKVDSENSIAESDETDNEMSVGISSITVQNKVPTANIDSISPNPATKGQTVYFSGSGSDSDGSLVSFSWRSSVDGFLGASNSFSISTLSVGTHTIYFKVKDNSGEWSNEASKTLTINDVQKLATSIAVGSISGKAGETVRISAVLSDSNGKSISNKKLVFTVGDYSAGSAFTDSNGRASVDFTIPSSWSGTKNILVRFDGDSNYGGSEGRGTLTMEEKYGGSLTVYVKDKNGNRIDAEVFLNDKSYGIAYGGVLEIKNLEPKGYTVTVKKSGYGPDKKYIAIYGNTKQSIELQITALPSKRGGEWIVIFGDKASTEDVTRALDIADFLYENGIVATAYLESEVTPEMLKNHNVILIGGPGANKISGDYVSLQEFSSGVYIFRSQNNTYNSNKKAIVLAGNTRRETEYAVEFFTGLVWGDWKWGNSKHQNIPYLGGWLLSGFFLVGDLRDLPSTVIRGDELGFVLTAIAIVPAVGDGSSTVSKLIKAAKTSDKMMIETFEMVSKSKYLNHRLVKIIDEVQGNAASNLIAKGAAKEAEIIDVAKYSSLFKGNFKDMRFVIRDAKGIRWLDGDRYKHIMQAHYTSGKMYRLEVSPGTFKDINSFFPAGQTITLGGISQTLPNRMNIVDIENLVAEGVKKSENIIPDGDLLKYIYNPNKFGIEKMEILVSPEGRIVTAYPTKGEDVWTFIGEWIPPK